MIVSQYAIRTMAARMFAKNARRKPQRAAMWLAVLERYEKTINEGSQQ